MADAPERIHAWIDGEIVSLGAGQSVTHGGWSTKDTNGSAEYIRADVHAAALRAAGEALAPFADQVERFPATGSPAFAAWGDDEQCDLTFTVGELRRAQAALAALSTGDAK